MFIIKYHAEKNQWIYAVDVFSFLKKQPIQSRIGCIGISLRGKDKNACVITLKARY